MSKPRKLKVIIAIFYLTVLAIFLFCLFKKFSIDELTSYLFIKENSEYFFSLREKNLILITLVFITLTVFFIFMLGFGSPIALLGGFIFGKWLGTLIVTLSLTIGATLIYIFANYFFKDLIKNKFLNKFKNLESKFKRNELIYFILFRFIGLVPFQVANIMPIIFNISIKNYFIGTFLGIIPAIFVMVLLGSGIEHIIKQNKVAPSFFEILSSQEIYIPIIGFVLIFLFVLLMKKKFF